MYREPTWNEFWVIVAATFGLVAIIILGMKYLGPVVVSYLVQ